MKYKEHKFTSPLAVFLPRKTMDDRKVILNLNNYRNWQHHMHSDVKIAYTKAMEPQLKDSKQLNEVLVTLTYYKPTARRSDRSNVLCIHEKFFLDALVHYGWLEDDNDSIIVSTHYQGGEIARANPRVDITITQLPTTL